MAIDVKKERRSSRETLRRILSAARVEFGSKGLEGARIDDIAQRSGKTKQLIYHYYSSKDELYAEVVRASHEEAVLELQQISYDLLPPRVALAAMLTNIFNQYQKSPDMARLMLDENIHAGRHLPGRDWPRSFTAPLLEQISTILDRGTISGDFHAVPDKGKFFAAALTLVTACFLTGHVTTRLVGVDMVSPEGVRSWLDYSIGMLIDSLSPATRAWQPQPMCR